MQHTPAHSEITNLLRGISFLQHVDDALLQKLAAAARRRVYPANTALFHAGDPGHLLYIVANGWVRIERITTGGQTMIIARRGPGMQLGELALIDGEPRMADAVTDTECDILTVERDVFLECLDQSPKSALAIMRSLAEMVRNSGANLESMRSQQTLGRLAEVLLAYADTHGSPLGAKGAVQLNIKLTHQALADQVGAVRESVSRALSVLTAMGIVEKSRSGLVIKDLKRLRQMIAT